MHCTLNSSANKEKNEISCLTLPVRVDAELCVQFLVSLRLPDRLHVDRVLMDQIQPAVRSHAR